MKLETVAANEESMAALADGVAQLTAAAAQLERTAVALETRFSLGANDPGGEVGKVVAAIESDSTARLAELELKLRTAERKIAELCAQAGGPIPAGRKTLSVSAASLLAKHSLDTADQVHAGALDAALVGLSLEQRIAVKSQLMRAGLLG